MAGKMRSKKFHKIVPILNATHPLDVGMRLKAIRFMENIKKDCLRQFKVNFARE